MSTSNHCRLNLGHMVTKLACSVAESAAPAATTLMETSIGALEFRNGVPTAETARRVHDNLTLVCAIESFLRGLPGVQLCRLREAQRRLAGTDSDVLNIFFKPISSKLRLVASTASRYEAWSFIDISKNGPTIIGFPPAMLGAVKDMWSSPVAELGPAGHDAGRGAKYLILPPDYEGRVPGRYFVLRPRTNRIWIFVRCPNARPPDHAARIVAEKLKIYSLTPANRARTTRLIDGSQLHLGQVAPNDLRFFEDLHQMVQTEPSHSLETDRRSLFASIGIVKGQPYRPNVRMKRTLADAVAIGSATVGAINYYARNLHRPVEITTRSTGC